MTDYIALRINVDQCSSDITDLLAAYLADIGYETFDPDETGLTAYIEKSGFNTDKLSDILTDFPMDCDFSYKYDEIKGEDWNAEWEKNYFKPIMIGDRCLIHSSFHTDLPEAEHDIVIDPKMAFGTGHHSTTSLMVSYLLDMDIKGKSVIDMGTGTGILAILCAQLGAENVTGIEIDPVAYENAIENVRLNNTGSSDIKLICGDASSLPETGGCDIFIANINRNIILADMVSYVKTLKPGATVLFSGFLTQDIDIVSAAAAKCDLRLEETRKDKDWIALRFSLVIVNK